MKRFLLAGLFTFIGASAFAQSAQQLVRHSADVHRLIRQEANYMTQRQIREVSLHLREIRRIVRSVPEQPANYYSSIAACTTPNGTPDLRAVGLGNAVNLTQSRQLARENVQDRHSCAWGNTIVEDSDGLYAPTYCVAACLTPNGAKDLRNSKGASGQNAVEAKAHALMETVEAYSCVWGVAIDICSAN